MKTEKTEYLSNQLTFAYSDWNFIFPIKFGTSEQIFIFWISKMFHILGKLLLKLGWLGYPEIGQKIFCHSFCLRLLRQTAKALKSFAEAIAVAFGMYSCNYSKCYEILMQSLNAVINILLKNSLNVLWYFLVVDNDRPKFRFGRTF